MSRTVKLALMAYLVGISVIILVSGQANRKSIRCNDDCRLPYCYCRYLEVPGKLKMDDAPQLVTFTYTGAIDEDVRSKLTELFPDSYLNPNYCSITTTLFDIGDGSDHCAIHKLYIRGHEIATSGWNYTGDIESQVWNLTEWDNLIEKHRKNMTGMAYLGRNHVRGMRAQNELPGGDEQFKMLGKYGFLYDSSILAGPLDNSSARPWPFTLDVPFERLGFRCRKFPCPTKSYRALWEVPILQMFGPSGLCVYIDGCVGRMKTRLEVFDLLYSNLDLHYSTNKAPLQINLQYRSLQSDIVMDGIRDFIWFILERDELDIWVVSIQETLQWIQYPTINSKLIEGDLWGKECHGVRKFNRTCLDIKDTKIPPTPFGYILAHSYMWLWQIIALILLYIVLYKMDQKKKK